MGYSSWGWTVYVSHRPGSRHRRRSSIGDNYAPSLERRRRRHRHDVADDARYDPAVNVDGGPSPAALDNDADNGGAGNTLVQAAVVSVISNAAKSSLRAYFEGVRWPLNKAAAFRLS